MSGTIRISSLPGRTRAIYRDEAFYRIKPFYLHKWLCQHNPHYPDVWKWGARRNSRKHLRFLRKQKTTIRGFIDTKETRNIDARVMHYTDPPGPDQAFILGYMKHNPIRKTIGNYLSEKGSREAEIFLFVS